ncbi:MAG: radical SAM protein [Kiritimatiellia bacterium]|nr:radical SAM protein [Kiritimatiellia bacterium]
MNHDFKHVFGPVPSRRLGRSLGVDLVPFKTCSYDCIYCQLGRTTNKTVERREYVPLNAVLSELRRKLEQCRPDYITLSGSGEPTLYAPIGELIRGIKKRTKIPVAVLTNGSLLWDRDVQDALLSAEVVVPSLDAGDESIFQNVNRPHSSISFSQMVGGLVEFRKRYSKVIWLEVFLLGGITAIKAEVSRIAKIAKHIRPDRIQLNTVTRPPAEDFAFPVPSAQMKRFCRAFGGKAEVITEYQGRTGKGVVMPDNDDVLALLGRRPCTLKDIADGLNLHPTQVAKTLEHLRDDGKIIEQRVDNRIYYKPVKSRSAPAEHDNRVKNKIKNRRGT